ncbi:MAG: DUF1080 domain-containing protein [Pirellulaceae bacterium]
MKRISTLLITTAFLFLAGMPLAAQDSQRGRTSLFDGKTLSGWVTPDGQPASAGWEVTDGVLHLVGKGSGMILTDQEYRDFDLRFEWKITEGGNSGIKYRVQRYGGAILGIEYQLLDDLKHSDGKIGKGSTGSLYALYAPVSEENQLPTRPPGEFNESRIVVRGHRITHWLNGTKLLSVHVGNANWHARVAESKFKDQEGFGENRSGLIMLQEHGSEVWFRNITIKQLGRAVRQ